MKEILLAALGVAGAAISAAFGGWDAGVNVLAVCMLIDYVSGLAVAGIFRRSIKTTSGALSSGVCLKGLLKKIMCLVFVMLGHQLDIYLGTAFIRDGIIIAFISNEALSFVENAGLMGVPIPTVIKKAIEILQQRGAAEESKEKGEQN